MRVVLADPPAYTPWYDHELAEALARAGADVELATSHFRFAELPPRGGLPRASSASTRSPRASFAARAPGCRSVRPSTSGSPASLARIRTDVLHLQWLALPQIDVNMQLQEPRRSSPPTTCCPDGPPTGATSGSGSCAKFDRVVVHTDLRPRVARRASGSTRS